MNLLKILSKSHSSQELIKETKNLLQEIFKKNVELLNLKEIKELLDLKDLKKILFERRIIEKDNFLFIPIHDDEKIYNILKVEKDKEDLKSFLNDLKNSLKNILNNFKLYESAEKELLNTSLLFELHKALESNLPQNLDTVFKDLMFYKNLKGIFFKSEKNLVKLGTLEHIEYETLVKSFSNFNARGYIYELNGKNYYLFSNKKNLLLIDKDFLDDEEIEFLSSLLNLSSEWEKGGIYFSEEILSNFITASYREALKIFVKFLTEEAGLINPMLAVKWDNKWEIFPWKKRWTSSLIEFEKNRIFYKIKGNLGEVVIFEEDKTPKDVPLNFLKILADFLYIKKKYENLVSFNIVLKRILELVPKIEDIKEFLFYVCQIIKEELNRHYVGFLLKENEEYVRMKAGIGYERYEDIVKERLKIGIEGLSGYVTKTGEILYVPDVSKDPRYRLSSPKVKSEVAVPLKIGEEILGAMVVSSTELDDFTQDEIEILDAIAGLTATFIVRNTEISELKKEIKKLKENERFLDVILKNIPVGIIYADTDLHIKVINTAALYTLNLKEEVAKGNILCNIFENHEPGSPECIFKRSIKERFPFIKYNLTIEKGKEKIPISISSTFIYENEKITGLILMIEDIREVVALEEQLRRAERLSAIGKIAAHMAHEIKNPLASISVGIEYIHSNLPDEDPNKKSLGVILKEINRVDRLIKNLLSFARRPPLKRKRTNLKNLLEELLIFYSHEFRERKITLKTDFPEKELSAFIDEDQIREVLENLIRNAIEAMPEGGELKISLSERIGGMVSISIQDTGVGIEPSELKQIFEPFYTTKKGGSGLGLSIVHRIIEDHGGKISVESKPGEGTKFIIDLPK